jgi:hypothetical protein
METSMATALRSADGEDGASAAVERPVCGIVMPRSSIAGYSEAHWAAILEIVRTAAESAGFEASLVSTANDAGALEQRIMQNRHDSSIAVCDVSGKDPDVMFELGLRLALDRPTIIIKDDVTSYLFDIDAIECLEYQRDLHKSGIADFKKKLAQSIESTFRNAVSHHDRPTSSEQFVRPLPARTEEMGAGGFLSGNRRLRTGRR